MREDNRLWTSSYILNNVTCFILNVSYYLLMVIMTDYAIRQLGASLSAAGFATGAFIIGALLARFLMGGQIERIGLKLSAYLGIFIFLAGLIVNIFVTNIWLLSVVRIVQGFGFGIGSTTTGAIMARMVPTARRGEGTSYYAMFVTLATAIGPYAGGMLYNGSIDTDLIFSAVLLVICIICVRYIKVPQTPLYKSLDKYNDEETSLLSRFIEPKAMPVAIITLLVSLGFAGILGFISSYEKEAGLTAAGRYFFIVYAVFTLISRPFTGRLFDKRGADFVMYPSFIIFGLGLLLLSVATTGWQLLLVAACLGFGFGPTVMGLAIPKTGFSGLYLVLAIIQFVCAGLYAWYAYSLPENGESNIPERLFGLDRQVITDLAGKGSCVIVGRLADNYDFSVNSDLYGIDGTSSLILDMVKHL